MYLRHEKKLEKKKLAVVVPYGENAYSAHWFSSPCVPGFDLH